MKKQLLSVSLSIFLAFLSSLSFANTKPNLKVMGQIMENGTEAPLPYVTISLHNKIDSTLLGGTISDENGQFEIKQVIPGEHFLLLSFVGFENKYIDKLTVANGEKTIDLGKITLHPASLLIEEVTVKAKSTPLSSTINKQIISADQNINATGGSAIDLLRNSASIEVSANDEVTLRGSAKFIVLLDGKPSVLSASDILRQTPANQIKQIEIITNPPVKYSADGGAGVINIIRKKGIPNSLNAMLNMSVGSGDKYGSDLMLNWNNNKWSLSAGLDWKDNTKLAENDYLKKYVSSDNTLISTLDQDREMRMSNLGFRLGLNYDPNDKQNFNYSLHSGYNQFDLNIDAKTHGSTEPQSFDNYHVLTFDMHQKPVFLTNNLGYSYLLSDKGAKLDINTYYSYIDYYFLNTQSRVESDADYFPISSQPYLQDVSNDNYSHDLRTTLDLNIPINKNLQIESGLSWHNYLRNLDVDFSEFSYDLNAWVSNPLYTHIFDFNETVYAAYANMNTSIMDYKISLGLRSEYMDRYLLQTTENMNYDYAKLNFFPSFKLSRNFQSKHDLGLAFSNRINRPNEYLLNPYPEFEDDYFYSEGNPNLIPEIVRNLEMNYRFIHQGFMLSSNLFVRMTEDKIEQLMEEGVDGKLKLSHHNDANDITRGLEIMGNFNFYDWWSLNASTSGAYHTIKGRVAETDISKSNYVWSAQMVNSFNLGKKTSLQTINFYRSKTHQLQYDVSAFHFMDVAVNHKFLDGKLSVGIQAKDIFKSMNYELTTVTENTLLTGKFKNESPIFMLNISYQINQYKKLTKDVETEFDM